MIIQKQNNMSLRNIINNKIMETLLTFGNQYRRLNVITHQFDNKILNNLF